MTNPYRKQPGDPSMAPSLRIARWSMLLALIGVLVFGVYKSNTDHANFDALDASPTVVHENGRITDVETIISPSRGGKNDTDYKVTVVTESGAEFTYRAEKKSYYQLGDTVQVTHDEGNPMWYMESPTSGHSTADVARNGMGRMLIGTSSVLLGLVAAWFIYKWTRAWQWDRQNR